MFQEFLIIHYNVLYVIYFKKVILKTSLIAPATLFFCSSDFFKENPAFHWTCDLAFKLTGIVVRFAWQCSGSFLCLSKEEKKLLTHNQVINKGY